MSASAPRTGTDHAARLRLARLSLEGLSVGDAFGQRWFVEPVADRLARRLPVGPWPWTDDTHMALSVFECLSEERGIDPDALARRFARRFAESPGRGYGAGAFRLLRGLGRGGDWRIESPGLFDGAGSFGNGAAMRVAPLGAYFHDDVARVVDEARRSAIVTHAHPEGQAGAVAVAVAAARLAGGTAGAANELLSFVAESVPAGETRRRIELSAVFGPGDFEAAAFALGCGDLVSAQDTVPYCLWIVAHERADFAAALWRCVDVGGDLDTTCAIVGGLVALAGATVPPAWVSAREPLEGVAPAHPGAASPT